MRELLGPICVPNCRVAENDKRDPQHRLISTRETAEFCESPRVELEGIEPSSVRWSRDALRPFP